MKPSVSFVCFISEDGRIAERMDKRAMPGNLLLMLFIARPLLEAAYFCLFICFKVCVGSLLKPQKCILISAILSP